MDHQDGVSTGAGEAVESVDAAARLRMKPALPWTCPQHPAAQIRHSWDQKHYVMNGYPAGSGFSSNHKYECAECGLELAPGE